MGVELVEKAQPFRTSSGKARRISLVSIIMKKNIIIALFILADLYLFSYIFVRQTHIEVWEKDKKEYVIFPENKILYYIYRPITLVDGAVTGMRFHIGPHQ